MGRIEEGWKGERLNPQLWYRDTFGTVVGKNLIEESVVETHGNASQRAFSACLRVLVEILISVSLKGK